MKIVATAVEERAMRIAATVEGGSQPNGEERLS